MPLRGGRGGLRGPMGRGDYGGKLLFHISSLEICK